MVIESGKVYFIKDEFIEKYGEQYNLMKDHEDEKNRPCYFCFRDDKCNDMLCYGLCQCLLNITNILIFIVISKKK